MSDRVVLLTIPGLAGGDVAHMPNLRSKLADGDRAVLAPSCPCTPGPVRANIATGVTCGQHGIVADCLYSRQRRQHEPESKWSDFLEAATIWQILREHEPLARSAVCFVPGSHASGASVTCNFDRSRQALVTHPGSLVAELSLLAAPLQSNDPLWIAKVVSRLTETEQPDFLWCEFSQIAAAAELGGPESPQVKEAQRDVDASLGMLCSTVEDHYGSSPLWLVVSPYTISATNHVLYPNRLLVEAGLLDVASDANSDPDPRTSRAWAITDHQLSHVYVKDRALTLVSEVIRLFAGRQGVAEVLAGDERSKYDLVHERAGDVIVISTADSWQNPTPWPSEKFAHMVRGSHGAPATNKEQRGTIFASEHGVLAGRLLLDTDICDLVLRQFGI